MKKLLFTLSVFLGLNAFAQEIKKGERYQYARKIVDTMASESMHGRGYVNGGDAIAANYLKTEFQAARLKSFNDNYYQEFSFAVNTFPQVWNFYWSGIGELQIGKDYIISASSASASMLSPMSRVAWLDSAMFNDPAKLKKFLKKKLRHSFIAVDVQNKKREEIIEFFEKSKLIFRGLLFIEHKKLIADLAQKVSSFPVLEVLVHDTITLEKLKKKSHVDISYTNKFIPDHVSRNVIGFVPGSVYPDSFIVFSAHYDHIGEMGKAVFTGANDNASGCAMLLNLARYYSSPEHRPKYSVAFIAFGAEEVGLLGSRYFTEHPLFPLKNIRFLLNMDIMGTGEEGITVVNGSVFKTEFDKIREINTSQRLIADVKIRGKAANSDHYYFSEKGVRAFFVYTLGGIKAYHDIYDRAETLPLNEFEDLFQLIVQFGDYLQG